MAGGFHSAAESGLGRDWGDASGRSLRDEIDIDLDHHSSIEVTQLDEETSMRAAQKLKERQHKNRPINVNKFQCRTQDDETAYTSAGENRVDKTDKYIRAPWEKFLLNRVPFLTWARNLDKSIVQADVIAGLTVGVMVIPQGMSYAAIAGLPYIYGLYAACVPAFIYAFFGQSRQLAVGPVAMVSLIVEAGLRGTLTQDECPESFAADAAKDLQAELCPDAYARLTFMTSATIGVFQIVGCFLKAGFLVSFLGHPVTSGFTSGAAIIIGLSQLKYILGYNIPKSQYIFTTIYNICSKLGDLNYMTLILGVLWLVYLKGNAEFAKRYPKFKIMGALGPLISCAIGIFLMLLVPALHDDLGVKYIGSIPQGLMPLSIQDLEFGNVGRVLPTAISACLIGYMESIAIGKTLASKNGYEVEADQEMLALGLANLVGSFFSCYPVTGSFSRSAVNNSTGARSQLSGLITALLLFCTLLFLTTIFYHLPTFALAAVVLNSVSKLVAYDEAFGLWKLRKEDWLLWMVAALGTCILGVLVGLSVAVALSLIIVIYQSARPQIAILWRIPGTNIYRNMKQEGSGAFVSSVFICRIGSSMYFANALYIKDMILTYVSDLEDINKTRYVVLEMTSVVTIDSTAVHVLHDIVHDFRSRNMHVAFCMVGNRVIKTMRKAGLTEEIGDQWFFPTVHDAVVFCLKHDHVVRTKKGEIASEGLDIEDICISPSNEVGISNDANNSCTVVYVTINQDSPTTINEMLSVFKKHGAVIHRAFYDAIDDTDESSTIKHTYFLKRGRRPEDAKLRDEEVQALKENLQDVIAGRISREPSIPNLGRSQSGIERTSVALAQALSGKLPSGDIMMADKDVEACYKSNGDGKSHEGKSSCSVS